MREHIKRYGYTFPVLLDRDYKVANQFSVFIDEKVSFASTSKTEQVILDSVVRIQNLEAEKSNGKGQSK